MPTAISSEHASLVHSPDACVPFILILMVLEGKTLVRHVIQYYLCFGDRLIFIVRAGYLASLACLGSFFMQPGWF